eukprot:2065263-Amphidinium_carterae.2
MNPKVEAPYRTNLTGHLIKAVELQENTALTKWNAAKAQQVSELTSETLLVRMVLLHTPHPCTGFEPKPRPHVGHYRAGETPRFV